MPKYEITTSVETEKPIAVNLADNGCGYIFVQLNGVSVLRLNPDGTFSRYAPWGGDAREKLKGSGISLDGADLIREEKL